MHLNQIQQKQKEFILKRKWDRFTSSQIFVHLIEELGEVGSHILYKEKYKVKGAGHKNNQDTISKELAQVFNLFLQLCIQENVDIEKSWNEEFENNLKRFDIETWEKLAEEEIE